MIGNDFLCTFKNDYEEKKFLRGVPFITLQQNPNGIKSYPQNDDFE